MSEPASLRVLVLMKFFSEGYGGTPESILLLGRNLAHTGIVCDVVTPDGLFQDIHTLRSLPPRNSKGRQVMLNMHRYGGLFVAGPWIWQAPSLCRRARAAGIAVSYAAKGGLAKAEFRRLRDIKKIPYFILLESQLLGLARRVVFSSPAERDNCLAPSFLWRGKEAIVPEPFEPKPPLSRKTRDLKPDSATLVLGFMAEIAPRKGLRELVEGFAQVRAESGRPMILRIAGSPRPGSEAYLAGIRRFAESCGVAAHLEWIGAVRSEESRAAFYDSIDIFLCPSTFESFGLTPLEALWQGVPVVMGALIGCHSYMPRDAPVAIFPAISPRAIAAALAGILPHHQGLTQRALAWRGRPLPQLSGAGLARTFGDLLLGRDV